MAPASKRKRQSSATSVTSRTSRAPTSRQTTPPLSIKRPSLASQQQPQRRRVKIASLPRSPRQQSINQVPASQSSLQSAVIEAYDIDESLDIVVVALDIKERGTVGCAYYVAREERLFCMEDIFNGGMDVVEACE